MGRPASDRLTVYQVRSRRLTPWRLAWRAFDELGKRRAFQVHFATEAEARTEAAKVEGHLAKLAAAHPPPLVALTKRGVTVREHLEEWLATIVARRKASTRESYTSVIRTHVIPVVGDLVLSPQTFGPHDIGRVITAMEARGLSWGYQQMALLVLSSSMYWAVQWGRLTTNPCTRLGRGLKPSTAVAPEPNPLTSAEMEAFLQFVQTGKLPKGYEPRRARLAEGEPLAARGQAPGRQRRRLSATGYPHWYGYFLLLCHTGLRRNEATGLQWASVHLDVPQPYLVVEVTFSAAARRAAQRGQRQQPITGLTSPKTKKSKRKVWLSATCVEMLRALARTRREVALRNRRPLSPFVFVGPVSGTRIEGAVVDKIFRTVLQAIGLADCEPRFTVHCLRDTFATRHIGPLKSPLGWVSAMLGHTKKSTTLDIYDKWMDQDDPVNYADRMPAPLPPAPRDPDEAKVRPFPSASERPN
jgi:integrase